MRFDPFGDFDRMSRHVWGNTTRANYMPVDAYRSGDRFHLHIDMPGIDPETIDLTVEKSNLTITSERRWDPSEVQVLLNERPTGSFSRSFFLGEGLDTDAIEAGYDHGVLTVTIPITETAKARKIKVGEIQDALAS